MRIRDAELRNFRRFQSVRIEIAEGTTLFVGANNSGKTSAMRALRLFLARSKRLRFSPHDICVLHWDTINAIGRKWEGLGEQEQGTLLQPEEWIRVCPSLDVWLEVEDNELHRVIELIPTLDWKGGLVGMRLRLEPEDLPSLFKAYVDARGRIVAAQEDGGGSGKMPRVWPEDMMAFLGKHFASGFPLRAYALDPDARKDPKDGKAIPQEISADAVALEGNPLTGLVRIDEIAAQRGFGEETNDDGRPRIDGGRLSAQLQRYYRAHLSPFDNPTVEDLDALRAVEGAQEAFDKELRRSFASALREVSSLGYPGVADPRVTIATRLDPVAGLEHSSAVQYEVGTREPQPQTAVHRLPEESNGLGYQNLISMVFQLMSFRDAWMRVGKADANKDVVQIEPLHLVLAEEPEAHLHAQVQQVFINKAYSILRNHPDLGDASDLSTQLVVSTHSSHVAHELEFGHLRHFRRVPGGPAASVPSSIVVNLSTVFGPESETERFVTRYLRSLHCDLFFADAAVLVEGSAERMLLPLFMRRRAFDPLSSRYISLLEIGGSHAQRLQPLIEALGLTTLIVTDLDAAAKGSGDKDRVKATQPSRGQGQVTTNSTLKSWLPRLRKIDQLVDAPADQREIEHDGFAVRVAYQRPIRLKLSGDDEEVETVPYTFEDALVLSSPDFFKGLRGDGMTRRVRLALDDKSTASELAAALFQVLESGKKAAFALDIVTAEAFETLAVPEYIQEGLEWLREKLRATPDDVKAQDESSAEPA